ncbi:GNAT family N-acetyltransferase [Salinibacillus xinjiangensis]|uniref:GNAT family N-acetyltransferase n=1 Tax=Salinibacillus xinjiangensis TaxID=1229268 RepID=A0A6G1X566_9BACI|nr:GNAT family N-acetyltransferase [Salinibacillus xinjiangensis]MRG86141.1 GNAT family N-acetyltransferase [Salinibacillus xinjiangensis]
MIIRSITLQDAEKFMGLIEQVEADSKYMLFEAGERKLNLERQAEMIEGILSKENSTILVAETDQTLVGYLIAMGGQAKRNSHSAYLVAGILSNYRGKGIGTKLFHELEKWARERGLHRLELTVVAKNDAGLALYQKQGFKIEGTKRNSLYIDGEYVNEYYMGKLLKG